MEVYCCGWLLENLHSIKHINNIYHPITLKIINYRLILYTPVSQNNQKVF